MEKLQSLFISHGGGPLPILGDPSHNEMVEVLTQIAEEITKPSFIICISAHWEEDVFTITNGVRPQLIYDYYGFPRSAYEIKYSPLGAPELADRIASSLNKNNISANLNNKRGFDHGLFIPLKIMYPLADIPCIQISLKSSLDPQEHIQLGEALKQYSSENILIIGSGFSFHNLNAFFNPNLAESTKKAHDFDVWLADVCTNKLMTEDDRRQALIDWKTAPYADYCHPRSEHLVPLFACYGTSLRPCRNHYSLKILNQPSSMFLW